MADHSSESIPFPVLTHVLRMGYHRAVVHHALTRRGEVTPQARRRLEEALRAEVQIKGFRDPTTAPPPLMVKEVVKCCHISNRLFGGVLQVWVESHASLQEAVRQFLISRGTPVMHATDLQDGFTSSWSPPSKMLETAKEFLAKHAEYDRDDVALMLCCLTSQAPLPEKDMEEANQSGDQDPLEEEHGVNWDRWLAELRALPAEAPKWDGADAFGEAFRQLVEAKRQERDRRLRLQQAFTALATQGTDELAFFDMTDVQAWMAETCPLEEAVAVTEKVNDLLSLLIRHREQNQQPAPTYTEERLRRKNLEQLEEHIKQLHDDLVSVFMPSSVPPLPQPVSQEPFLKEEQPQEQEVLLNPFTVDASPKEELPPAVSVEHEPGIEDTQVDEKIALPVSEETAEKRLTASVAAEEIVPRGTEAGPESTASPEIEFQPTAEITVLEHQPLSSEVETITSASEAEPKPTTALLVGLQPAAEIATLLQKENRDEHWHALLWALIAEGDLPAAYWLARSLPAAGYTCPVSDWLLGAVQAARWLSPDSDAFVADSMVITQSFQKLEDHQGDRHHRKQGRDYTQEAHELLQLAAALWPALTAPGSGLLGWLVVPECCHTLHSLVTAVKAFASLQRFALERID